MTNRNPTKPGYIENLHQMRVRARYGENGPDPRWPEVRIDNLREVQDSPAVALADVHLSELRQRLLDVVLCTDGARYWATLPRDFELADTTTELGYQGSIVLGFLAELGVIE